MATSLTISVSSSAAVDAGSDYQTCNNSISNPSAASYVLDARVDGTRGLARHPLHRNL